MKFCIDSVFTRISSNLGRADDEMLSNSASSSHYFSSAALLCLHTMPLPLISGRDPKYFRLLYDTKQAANYNSDK